MIEGYRFGLDPEHGLKNDDVVSVGNSPVAKFSVLIKALTDFSQKVPGGYYQPWKGWFTEEGIEINFLRTEGGGWQKGRFRFRLEFIPDNPEAFSDQPNVETLDEILTELTDNE